MDNLSHLSITLYFFLQPNWLFNSFSFLFPVKPVHVWGILFFDFFKRCIVVIVKVGLNLHGIAISRFKVFFNDKNVL